MTEHRRLSRGPDDASMEGAEQTILALMRAGARTIAFASPEPRSGTSACAAMAADVLARSGQSTLLIDLSAAPPSDTSDTVWIPGHGEMTVPSAGTGSGYSRLTVLAVPETRFLFDNVEWFRSVLDISLASFEYIVLDLAPFNEKPESAVSPLPVSAACDALVLVGRRGRVTRQKLKNAVEMTQAAGGHPFGIVLTQGGYTSPGEEVARLVRRLLFFAPGLAKRIGRKATTSEILG